MIPLHALFAFLPVCLFLLSLLYLDSYKLVKFRTVVQLVIMGALLATASLFVNDFIESLGVERQNVLRFVAPAVEELLKALPLIVLIRRKRIAFLVDAAINGFAVGTGFALLENLYYLSTLQNAHVVLWIVRGFGTALMHGGAVAIMAMTTVAIAEKRRTDALWTAIPGLVMAFLIHAMFNQFVLSPLASTVVIVLILPPLVVLVFSQSERYLQSWLGVGFDLDADLVRAITSGEFGQSPAGDYLRSLREHFEGPVMADMLCYLRLHSELSLRAKGVLMLHENGFTAKKDPDVDAKLDELRFLKKSIGKTGELALKPILNHSSRDLWQLQMLEM
ncbi:MAG: PrsW family glutamic-type intramembrane protease [Thermoanaerobaculia bacterium]